jgi:uncharacterized repeat protein (TIGR03803 family)
MRICQTGCTPFGMTAPLFKLSFIAVAAAFVLLSASVGLMQAQNVTLIYSFSNLGSSANPIHVIPAQGRDAKLYGTTEGTSLDFGSIFRVQTTGAGTTLYALDGTEGSLPDVGLTLASDGNFYGTTFEGGTANYGVLFRITPAGVYTVLHNFAGGTDGGYPLAAPVEASNGSIYGTTLGPAPSTSTVYQYTLSGAFSTIYQFDGTAGEGVVSGVIQGADGNLYGTASEGGANNCGTIFKMTTAGTLLRYFSFKCGLGGASPSASLVQASDGNFYGTTSAGGYNGHGTIFKMGQKGLVSILYRFRGKPIDGSGPGALVEGTDGNLYGITTLGGKENFGALFSATKSGSYSLLYSFAHTVGQNPSGGLMQHTNGQLYGTAEKGGAGGAGSVFSLDMGFGPLITFVVPAAQVAQTAQILGQGFTGTTSVTFNGIAATSFKVASDTFLTAVVPSGATSGPVVVTTPSGTLTSNKSFTIVPGS